MAHSVKIIEKFSDHNHDGLAISLDITDKGHVYFGTRFEHDFKWQNANIAIALLFFRNIMTITTRDEWVSEFKKFKAANT